MSEQEFHDQFVEAVVRTLIPMLEGVRMPPGLTQGQARRFHATYLANFSFFAWKFPSWLMAIAARCPFQDVRRGIIEDCVDEEVGDVDAGGRCHIDVLYDEAEACGIHRDEIAAMEPSPVVLACVHALDSLAHSLSWQGSFAAISGLEIVQSEPAVRLRKQMMAEVMTPEEIEQSRSGRDSNALSATTGLPPEQLAFAALHEYKDQFHGGGELALIVKYGDTRAIQDEMLWAGRAAAQVYGVMRQEIDRLARAVVGIDPLRAVGTTSGRF